MNSIGEIKDLIEGNALALATISEDGWPHCVAVSFVKVVSENEILISDNYLVETAKNLKNNPNIALAVWSRNWEDECEGYEMKGTAEYIQEGEWLKKVKAMPENEGLAAKAAIIVIVDRIKKLA